TDPRDIILNPSAIDENVPATTLVGTLTTVDPDQGDTFTYALVTGTGSTDNAAFTLTTDGKLSINASPDFEQKSSYSIRVRTTDAGNRTFEKILTVSINDLPETPGSTDPRDILLSPSAINENVPATTLVGTLTTVDPDQGDTFTYALVTGTGSTDNAAFTLTTDGKLSINASPDFEQKSSYSIRVRTTDAGNRSLEKVLTVSINNLPENPGDTDPRDILLSPSAINENVPATTLVGTLSTVDPDQGDTFTYALVSGTGSTDNAAFTLTADGKLSINASPDFEAKPTYSIRVRTTDFGNRTFEKVLVVNVNNIAEPPVVTTSAGAASYSENGAAITIDSGISVSDIDSTQLTRASIALGGYVPGQDQLQFTNQNGISGNFDTATGILTLTGNASLAAYQTALRSIRYLNSSDGPDTTPRTIRFTITDEANLTSNIASRTIQIVPNNDAPTVTTSAGALAYTEKSGA
ncbi:MAG TPA: cadherin repeat domain-containing protein, partial [Allocoleopsis sp.]